MKAVQPSRAEKEALEWAIEEFRDQGAVLTKIAGRNISNDITEDKLVEWHDREIRKDPKKFDKWMASHIRDAVGGNGFEISDMCRLAARLLERGDKLPSPLRQFVADFLRNPAMKTPRKRGPNGSDFRHRNFMIAGAIFTICDKWGFPGTRNNREKIPVGRNHALVSAASIVKVALAKSANLNLSEAAINKIWHQHHTLIGVPAKELAKELKQQS